MGGGGSKVCAEKFVLGRLQAVGRTLPAEISCGLMVIQLTAAL